MRKKIGVLWGLIFCTVLFMSCASKGGKDTITVYGMVYDSKNNPVQDYEILINSQRESFTDFGGRFVIYDVPKGMCEISGNKPGFSSSRENLYLDGKKIIYLRVKDLEEFYAACFESMENGNYDEAEKTAKEILDLAGEDENAVCFLSVIDILRKTEELEEVFDEI